jgi:hypothetical protein
MSSAMVYGLLPVFLVKSLGATTASVGFIEGIAEAMMSLARICSGLASDWIWAAASRSYYSVMRYQPSTK